VELVDVDAASGDVVAVAVVLIQAAILTKSTSQKYSVSSLSRKQYQVILVFSLVGFGPSLIGPHPSRHPHQVHQPEVQRLITLQETVSGDSGLSHWSV
jgi:hypothetical protein